MAEDSTQEKTFDPTPRRVEQSREEGRVAQSRDVISAAQLLMALVAFSLLGGDLLAALMEATRWTIEQATAGGADGPTLGATLAAMGSLVLPAMLGLSLLMAAAAVSAGVIQTGFLWAPGAVAFKWDRVNPLNRLKETFHPRKLGVRTALAVGKILVAAAVIAVIFLDGLPAVTALALSNLDTAERFVGGHLFKMAAATTVVLSAMAVLDYAWQRREHTENLKMTREEFMRDLEQQEGKPAYKRRRRQMHRELSLNRIIDAVPEADVIVTNPTHLAVALRYRPGEDKAPVVTARGADSLALHIRSIARRHGVPIVENRPLARTLWRKVKVGGAIPANLFQDVAGVLARVYRARERRSTVKPPPRRS